MMKLKIIFICLFLFQIIVPAQDLNNIKNRNLELESLRYEITKLEKELSSLSSKEKDNLNTIKKIDKQNLLLNKSINNLLSEEKVISNKINNTKSRIKELENRIVSLRKEYRDYLIWVYKNGDNTTLKYLLNSESFNEALIRYKYLAYVHRSNKKSVDLLNTTKKKLNETILQLKRENEEKEQIISQKKGEMDILLKQRKGKEKILSNLKKNKKNKLLEIDEKRKMEIRIKQIIAELIEKERAREQRAKEEKLKGNLDSYEADFNYSSFENFSQLKGSLNWPIKNGKINRKFGENKNEKTKTVTLNYGVDLIAKSSQEVYAVAEGIVSAIEWIPGYGSVLIITHRDNFRTVYGHLTDIAVLEGNKVKAGEIIGKVNPSLEGNILHFEIWKERNYQNPTEWLAKK